MNINEKVLNGINKEVDVMNVKIDEDKIGDLIEKDGYFKAYHMNKKKWITILLDETLQDSQIMALIDESYKLINKL